MEKEIDKIVDALYVMRKSNKMTQKQVADKLGCLPNYMSMVERKRRVPSVSFLNQWAKVFNMRVYLFIGA
jgi:transcriptional regulator with XRE-family HTH domain